MSRKSEQRAARATADREAREARDLLTRAAQDGMGPVSDPVTHAQVHATLAVAAHLAELVALQERARHRRWGILR